MFQACGIKAMSVLREKCKMQHYKELPSQTTVDHGNSLAIGHQGQEFKSVIRPVGDLHDRIYMCELNNGSVAPCPLGHPLKLY